MKKKKIDSKDIKKGALHKRLGVPTGKKIPLAKIETDKRKAEKSGNTKAIRQDTFAINAKTKFKHKKKK